MISYEQACSFLDNILQMPVSWKDTLRTNKLEFLRLYMIHHNTRIPFQNVSMVAVDFELRKWPTESDIIVQGLTGLGGCCIHLNYFTKIVFSALGLESFTIQGTHLNAPVAGTHCMVIVKLNESELYLVEVGGYYPILDPVPMHKLPFRILTAGGFSFEFRKISESLIGRYHIGGGILSGAYINKTEALRTSWDLTPRKFSDFNVAMEQVFTNPEGSALLKNPMMCRYFFPNEILEKFPEINSSQNEIIDNLENSKLESLLHFVFIFKQIIVIGDANSRKIVKQFCSYKEMVSDIIKCFPMLHKDEIVKAFETFSQYDVRPSAYDDIL